MTETMTAEAYRNRIRGARNRAQGERTERLTKRALEGNGVEMVERIEVGWGGKPVKGKNGSLTLRNAYRKAKVAGDWRGVLDGRSVLCEAKHKEGRLTYSTIKPHQREALDTHAAAGGLSLVAWDTGEDLFLMEWPIDGFRPRSSITAAQAARVQWIG